MPNKAQRQQIANDTLSLTPTILTTHPPHSKLYPSLLPPLQPSTSQAKPHITVRNQDTFTAAETILKNNASARTAVLNMASEKNPGGGWLNGALAQEEALCLRSTLAATLYKRYYPLPVYGAVWSGVYVFRGEVDAGCPVYGENEGFSVDVLSMAALRRPLVTGGGKYANASDVEIVKNKIRQILRVLAENKISHCVLGALGCGAFRNPPAEVARIYKEVLDEDEWRGVFEEIVFAVLDTRGELNYKIFQAVFD
ncbi:hypothetical protein ASPWEDRAFT_40593 [Aspergillus wentii DTO 134E9]|uniref:Microbial-type PARG catalytic domain-containing protein n=1 Tax=Aspergillus wentii DTO 134E9 TaxID=1073089 RepID=A0A1L9RKM1_ASPWE|nr:uncharacterized protein ASPWEDRAFT_40593 [Aspergillus wentii DTO 134E9]OJJ35398.1 hypothetical protein ASPWEDRAFT_40593 [Aspergillus wentii DTO 134E9]